MSSPGLIPTILQQQKGRPAKSSVGLFHPAAVCRYSIMWAAVRACRCGHGEFAKPSNPACQLRSACRRAVLRVDIKDPPSSASLARTHNSPQPFLEETAFVGFDLTWYQPTLSRAVILQQRARQAYHRIIGAGRACHITAGLAVRAAICPPTLFTEWCAVGAQHRTTEIDLSGGSGGVNITLITHHVTQRNNGSNLFLCTPAYEGLCHRL